MATAPIEADPLDWTPAETRSAILLALDVLRDRIARLDLDAVIPPIWEGPEGDAYVSVALPDGAPVVEIAAAPDGLLQLRVAF